MNNFETKNYLMDVADFRDARRKASLETLLASIQGKPAYLLSYDQVRENLRPIESARRILEDIPLDKIVGSVNRTTDFTRSFLPLNDTDAVRWASVRAKVDSLEGLPPIEAYRVGDVYFILDGHHRVSVARELGQSSIQGYVTPVFTRVPLSPGDSPDDLIIKAEYTDFLAKTKIDELRPEANLLVSVPGQYPKLLEHIAVHRYFMGIEQHRDIPESEAVTDWYDMVYLPIIQLIREHNLLQDFPDRTETDLYLWIMDHRVELSQGGIGWEVAPEKAAADLVRRYSRRPQKRLPRIRRRLLNLLTPEPLEPGPPPGTWRSERQEPHRGDHLFDDILVTIPGERPALHTIDMAVEIASREGARLTGLHVLPGAAQEETPQVLALRESFLQHCAAKEVKGRFVTDAGQASRLVCERSPWIDLAVFRLAHPPSSKILNRLRSGVRYMIRHCTSPLLAVPEAPFNLDSALLAYGPGRNSEEALYVAAYLAGCWKIPLTVVSVANNRLGNGSSPTPLDRARAYLEGKGIQANYVLEKSLNPTPAILLNAEFYHAGFIITGSYEGAPLRESIYGSNVDRILRSTRLPVLVCH